MATQNKTTYQATVDTLAPDNATAQISESDVRTLYKNLSDSLKHTNPLVSSLSVNPTSWNVENYDQRYGACSITSNLSLALNNTTTTGLYTFYVIKNTASDLTAEFDDDTTLVTVRYPNAASNFKMTGASGSTFTFFIQRLAGTLIVRCEDGILDEDDFASNSATQAPSQQSVKAYVDGPLNSLGTEPASWDVNSYIRSYATLTVDATIPYTLSLSNTVDKGIYELIITKTPADVRVINFSHTGLTVDYLSYYGISTGIALVGDAGKKFIIRIKRIGTVLYPVLVNTVLNKTSLFTDTNINNATGYSPSVREVRDFVIDEDDMSSNSAIRPASQQSIKAYVDSRGGGLTNETFNAALDFTTNQFEKSKHTIVGAISFTLANAGTVNDYGNRKQYYLTADGINKPTLTADFEIFNDRYLNTAGAINRYFFEIQPNGKVLTEIINIPS